MDEDMQGTSVDLVNFNRELLQAVMLDITWQFIQKMTNRIRVIDDAHMRFTLNDFRQLRNDQLV